ncbi:nucleotidyltransferase domain-containing protein [Vibrio crassostreae]|uniref:nucleotidyltransferase domain-containing protein n=1 Tax=Vibrio crassostreae TaxID=246167 RepID=UPI001B313B59
MNIVDAAKTIQLKDVRSMLRWNPYSSRRDKVVEAKIVGSVAKGTATENSDIDIAVIIPRLNKSSLSVTELYHSKFQHNKEMPHHHGYRVDLQFFYEGDPVLDEYSVIDIN